MIKSGCSARPVCGSSYQINSRQGARIDLLDRRHPLVFAQARMQLAVAHVDADDVRRTVLQQAIGEAAGRLAHVEAVLARRVDAGGTQRAFQLEPAARDIARLRGIGELELGRGGDLVAVLAHAAPFGAAAGIAPAQSARDQADGL